MAVSFYPEGDTALVTADFRRSLIKAIDLMGGSAGVQDTEAVLVAKANVLLAAKGAPALSENDYRRTALAVAQALYTSTVAIVGYPEGTLPGTQDDESRLMVKINAMLASGGPPPPLNAPVATAATNITSTSFSANWNASAGAAGYRIDVATDVDFTIFVIGRQDLDVGNTLTLSTVALTPGLHFYFRVRAYNASGTSDNSNPVATATIPVAPVALASGNGPVGATGFTAVWTQNTGQADGYRLDVSTDPAFGSFVPGLHNLDVGLNVPWGATGLTPATQYYFRVRGYNASGTSANSNVVPVLTFAAVVWAPSDTAPQWGDNFTSMLTNLAGFNELADFASVSALDFFEGSGIPTNLGGLSHLSALSEAHVQESAITELDVTGCSNLTDLNISSCSLNSESVNDILTALVVNGLSNGSVDTSGNNAPPTGSGATAAATLVTRGWTVSTD